MEEKILKNKKNGMAVLLLTSVLYILGFAAMIIGFIELEKDCYAVCVDSVKNPIENSEIFRKVQSIKGKLFLKKQKC